MATLEVPGSPRPSSRARTNSVLSVSSELTDPEELDVNKTRSRAGSSSSGLSDVDDPDETEDDDEDDDIVEVNADGSAKCATRIRDLLNNPPKEPKHRWETAYVYAFVERFTTVQQDSAHAPQTILEFEQALLHGAAPVMPENAEDTWAPSLAPILHDFVDRGKRTHKEVGGSGGMPGKWQVWLPWWVEEQRSLGNSEFQHYHWRDTIKTMKEKDEEYKFFSLPWEKQLTIMKALVDYQVCLSVEIIKTINTAYGHETAGELAKKAKERKEQREQEQKEKEAQQPPEAKDAATTANGAQDKGKAPEKPKQTRAPREKPKEINNTLAITSIGTDSKKHVWYRINDSPRLYMNSNPIAANQTFVAVSDTPEDIKEILQALKSGPAGKAGKGTDPFSKALGSSKGKGKLTPRDQRDESEKKLHKKITSILSAMTSEETGYEAQLDEIRTRRRVLVEKRDKKLRAEALAAARAAERENDARVHGTRSSRRLRRGNRDSAGYDEAAGDDELEQALRASEREARKRKRSRDGEESDGSSSGSEARFDYGGMDLDNDDDEEDYDVEVEDDSQANRRNRRSTRAAAASSKAKPLIPGERRSTRVRQSRQTSSRESSEEPPFRGSSRRQASIVRSYSEDDSDDDEDDDEKAPFDGLEEVWSKGKYTGYFTVDRKFIPAKKGDIPLYKLARMGLPMPTEHGTAPDANVSAESSVPGSAVPTLELDNGNTSDESTKQEDRDASDDDSEDGGVVVVASKPTKPTKKRIKSDSPEVEVTSTQKVNGHQTKGSGSVNTSHIEVVID